MKYQMVLKGPAGGCRAGPFQISIGISATTRWIFYLSGSNESYGGVRYESEGIFSFYRLEEKLELHKVKTFSNHNQNGANLN